MVGLHRAVSAMATVVHSRPLIATLSLSVSDSDEWSMPGFEGIPSLVQALASVQSQEFVNAEALQALEEKARRVAPVVVVNPRGHASIADVVDDVDMEGDLPVMNRFEVVFEPSWAINLAHHNPSFGQLAERLIDLARSMAADGHGADLEPFWRVIVGFPGAEAQKWYADDVDDASIILCDVPLTTDGVHTRFPLGSDGQPIDLTEECASEFETAECVVYSADAVHYYTKVTESAPRVSLQLIMSNRGDPNDCIPSDLEDSDEED